MLREGCFGCNICSDDVWGAPKFKESLHGSMIMALGWATAWYWNVCDMGDRDVCGYLGVR